MASRRQEAFRYFVKKEVEARITADYYTKKTLV